MAFTVGFMVPTPVIVALQVAQRVSNLEVTIIARLCLDRLQLDRRLPLDHRIIYRGQVLL